MAKEVEVTKVDEPAETAPRKTIEVQDAHRVRKPWIFAIIAASVLLILILLGGVVGMLLHGNRLERRERGMYSSNSFHRSGTHTAMGIGAPGPVTSNAVRLNGVVTAVDGNTLTVAGSGKTTKVTVSDATIYSGDAKSAAVNDTVSVLGNKNSDGSIAASQMAISRQ